MTGLLASFLAVVLGGVQPDQEILVRDWTVEHPLFAGYLSGITLNTCPCGLGRQSEPAGPHDPFALTPRVKQDLARLSRRPYRLGQSAGAISVIFVVTGLLFHRLNTLKTARIDKEHR